jgi:hypothetical protein
MTDEIHPLLKKQAADYAAELLKAVTSPFDLVFPGSSKIVDFLVDQVLPRREERFATFITELSRRLKDLEQRLGVGCFGLWSSEKQALFEDGARVAIKALSPERIDHVAKIVAEGLTEDDAGAARTRLFLDLIGELSDVDLIVMAADTRLGMDPQWRAKHAEALSSPLTKKPPPDASPEQHAALNLSQREALIATKLQINRLVRLGVMEREEQHYIDERHALQNIGQVKTAIGRPRLSPLGTAVLIKLDIIQGLIPWSMGD